ncbi:uncharacterized protein LOC134820671 [Bolinopsis microptera]|uniref:uncharacterized protein LOC134820671 n=1 Tax=Bolinopsis microptera TaxID=2820187 RepID=UPI003079ED1C
MSYKSLGNLDSLDMSSSNLGNPDPNEEVPPPSPPPQSGCFTCLACSLVGKIDTELAAVRRRMFVSSEGSSPDQMDPPPPRVFTSETLDRKLQSLTSSEHSSDTDSEGPCNIQGLLKTSGGGSNHGNSGGSSNHGNSGGGSNHGNSGGGYPSRDGALSDYLPDDHDVFSPVLVRESPSIVIEFIDDTRLMKETVASEGCEIKSKSLTDDNTPLEDIEIVVDDVAEIHSHEVDGQGDVSLQNNDESEDQIKQLEDFFNGSDGSGDMVTDEILQEIAVSLDEEKDKTISLDSDLLQYIEQQLHRNRDTETPSQDPTEPSEISEIPEPIETGVIGLDDEAKGSDNQEEDEYKAFRERASEFLVNVTCTSVATETRPCSTMDDCGTEQIQSEVSDGSVEEELFESSTTYFDQGVETSRLEKGLFDDEIENCDEVETEMDLRDTRNSQSPDTKIARELTNVVLSNVTQEDNINHSNQKDLDSAVECAQVESDEVLCNSAADSLAQVSIHEAANIVVCEPIDSPIHGSTDEAEFDSPTEGDPSTQMITQNETYDLSGFGEPLADEILQNEAEEENMLPESRHHHHELDSVNPNKTSVKMDIQSDVTVDDSQIMVDGSQYLTTGHDEIEPELISSGPMFTPPEEEENCPLLSSEVVEVNEKCREWINSTSSCDEIFHSFETKTDREDQVETDGRDISLDMLHERARNLGITIELAGGCGGRNEEKIQSPSNLRRNTSQRNIRANSRDGLSLIQR